MVSTRTHFQRFLKWCLLDPKMYVVVVNRDAKYTRRLLEGWLKKWLQKMEKLVPYVYLFEELPVKTLIFTQNFENLRLFKVEEMSDVDYFIARTYSNV